VRPIIDQLNTAVRFVRRRPFLLLPLGAVVVAAGVNGVRQAGVVDQGVTLPKVYKPYVALDGSFTCDAPAAWQISDRSDYPTQSSGAHFSSNEASVDISSVGVEKPAANMLLGALKEAIVRRVDTLASWTHSPLDALHRQAESTVASHYDRYVEKEPEQLTGRMGDMLVSEWTAESTSPLSHHPMHGYRATMIGGSTVYTVVCACREEDWKHLWFDFSRMIRSQASLRST
jgi:hypothetical protein